jgi:hypothetical protein
MRLGRSPLYLQCLLRFSWSFRGIDGIERAPTLLECLFSLESQKQNYEDRYLLGSYCSSAYYEYIAFFMLKTYEYVLHHPYDELYPSHC